MEPLWGRVARPTTLGRPLGHDWYRRRAPHLPPLKVKVKQEIYDGFLAIANSQNWVLAETLERALATLKVKLAQPAKAADSFVVRSC